MRVPHSEEVANHAVLESCVWYPRGAGEALTEVRIGQPLSREINVILGAHAFDAVEGYTMGRASASAPSTRRGRRPQVHVLEASCAGIGRSRVWPWKEMESKVRARNQRVSVR